MPSNKKKGKGQAKLKPVNLFYPPGSSPDVTRQATVAAAVVSIELRAQLLLVESPLPTFFCL
jgi:hypothetical protein